MHKHGYNQLGASYDHGGWRKKDDVHSHVSLDLDRIQVLTPKLTNGTFH